MERQHQSISKRWRESEWEWLRGWRSTHWKIAWTQMNQGSLDCKFKNAWDQFIKLTYRSAPPDWGIASQQMSGKKSNKFRITVTFVCNQTSTEKWPIFYIGKSKQPRCFKKKKPSEYGFCYRNNKTAWMTAKFFEEWIKEFNQQFWCENWHVALTLDNFAGHKIAYEPTNIELIFFEPNLTPYVQPLDAGIIHCFKAHYWKAFCAHAVDMDEAGEEDVYKINLLEVMLMVRQAWDAVGAETIANCWKHTGITE